MQTSIFKFIYSFVKEFRDIELRAILVFEKEFFHCFLNSLKNSPYFSEDLSFQNECLFDIIIKFKLKCSHITRRVNNTFYLNILNSLIDKGLSTHFLSHFLL